VDRSGRELSDKALLVQRGQLTITAVPVVSTAPAGRTAPVPNITVGSEIRAIGVKTWMGPLTEGPPRGWCSASRYERLVPHDALPLAVRARRRPDDTNQAYETVESVTDKHSCPAASG
jgi:hypothetical protein